MSSALVIMSSGEILMLVNLWLVRSCLMSFIVRVMLMVMNLVMCGVGVELLVLLGLMLIVMIGVLMLIVWFFGMSSLDIMFVNGVGSLISDLVVLILMMMLLVLMVLFGCIF